MSRRKTREFKRVVGVGMLVLACVAWGSSFPAIKIIVGSLELDPAAYTALRNLLTLAVVAPFVLGKRLRFHVLLLLAGLSYALGTYLQGLGTAYTTASNSAFITSLHMVFVYAYETLKTRKLSPRTLATIVLAAVGVYLLVGGIERIRIGDIIVLISSVFWASQVILVSKLSREYDVAELLFWQLLITVLIFTPSTIASLDTTIVVEAMPGLVYLALVPGLLAFT
ncbi:MAG TPA: DMT family transporter, partial [Pyrodictiaceae archaeon]|nr:DMT family transporter [Pyrodictiaceae archaeon]